MALQLDSIVVQDSEPIASKVDDEVVMLSIREGAYFGLGLIGSEIWALIASPRRVDELCADLLSKFEVDASTCEREVVAFLDTLVARGLVRVVDGQDGPRA